MSDAVVVQVEQALNNRELLKLKVLETAPGDAREVGERIAGEIDGAHVVQVIGRTIVLFRRHPREPKIRLPG